MEAASSLVSLLFCPPVISPQAVRGHLLIPDSHQDLPWLPLPPQEKLLFSPHTYSAPSHLRVYMLCPLLEHAFPFS